MSTTDSFPDLLRRVRAGDGDAKDELFQLAYPSVAPLVHRSLAQDVRIGRPWLVARFSTGDIVQEVCRTVLADLGAFGGKTLEDFQAFLAIVARNRIVDAIRFHEAERRDGRRSGPDLEGYEPDSRQDGPVELAARQEIQEEFLAALAVFPEREQLLIRARLDDSASFAELARFLGYSSTTTAKRTYADARARIAARMSLRLEEGQP